MTLPAHPRNRVAASAAEAGFVPGEGPHWDLSPLYSGPNDPALGRDLDLAAKAADDFAARYRDRVSRLSPEELQTALRALEAFLSEAYRPSLYASLAFSTATNDAQAQAMHAEVRQRSTDIFNRMTFFDIELKETDETTFDAWISASALASDVHHLKRLRRTKPHTLSEPEERVAALKHLTGAAAWSQLYTELTSAFEFTMPIDGAERHITLAEARALRSHPDREVRKAATAGVLSRFAENEKVLTYIVNTLYQDHRIDVDLRHFATPMAPTILDDELTEEVVLALIDTVVKGYPVAQKYFRIKARALGLESQFATCDLLAPYPGAHRAVSWNDAKTEVLAAFEGLTPDFAACARRFFDERRIDAEPRPGKRDGAFCMGMIPGLEPYVLVNFTGRLEDVATLAHELGHGVHFSMAGRQQTLLRYFPTTPLAETASVFGEMVLLKRLLGRESDPIVRRQLLASRIEDAIATVMRQIAYIRFERSAHDRRAQGVVPASEYCDLWQREIELLYGDAVALNEFDRWGWITIPHLIHYRFYCYSYALGQLLVFALYRRLEDEGPAFVPRYLDLLAAGGSDDPQALLEKTGIDMADPEFWRRGVSVIEDMVNAFDEAPC